MKKQICIVYEPCDEIKQGKSVITGDGSMIYVPSPSKCPFSESAFRSLSSLPYTFY